MHGVHSIHLRASACVQAVLHTETSCEALSWPARDIRCVPFLCWKAPAVKMREMLPKTVAAAWTKICTRKPCTLRQQLAQGRHVHCKFLRGPSLCHPVYTGLASVVTPVVAESTFSKAKPTGAFVATFYLQDSVFWGSFAGFTIMLHAPHYRSRGVGGVSGLQVLYAVHELNFKSSAPQTLVWRCEKP